MSNGYFTPLGRGHDSMTARIQAAIFSFSARNNRSPNVIYLNDVDYELLKEEWKASWRNNNGTCGRGPRPDPTANVQITTTFMGIQVRLTELPSTVAYESRI
jgi:hypothetical protein